MIKGAIHILIQNCNENVSEVRACSAGDSCTTSVEAVLFETAKHTRSETGVFIRGLGFI